MNPSSHKHEFGVPLLTNAAIARACASMSARLGLAVSLACVLCLLTSPSVLAADPAPAANPFSASPKLSAAPPDAASQGSGAYKLSKSLTVDQLAQTVFPDSPLSPAVLRKALLAANPKVLNGKPTQSLKAGTSISLPDHSQLLVQTLTPFAPPPPAPMPCPAPAPVAVTAPPPAPNDAIARRNWVQFP